MAQVHPRESEDKCPGCPCNSQTLPTSHLLQPSIHQMQGLSMWKCDMALASLRVVFSVQRLPCKAAQRMHGWGWQYSVVHCKKHGRSLAMELQTGQEDSHFHSTEEENRNISSDGYSDGYTC